MHRADERLQGRSTRVESTRSNHDGAARQTQWRWKGAICTSTRSPRSSHMTSQCFLATDRAAPPPYADAAVGTPLSLSLAWEAPARGLGPRADMQCFLATSRAAPPPCADAAVVALRSLPHRPGAPLLDVWVMDNAASTSSAVSSNGVVVGEGSTGSNGERRPERQGRWAIAAAAILALNGNKVLCRSFIA